MADQRVEQLRVGAEGLQSMVIPLVGQVAELTTREETLLCEAQNLASQMSCKGFDSLGMDIWEKNKRNMKPWKVLSRD